MQATLEPTAAAFQQTFDELLSFLIMTVYVVAAVVAGVSMISIEQGVTISTAELTSNTQRSVFDPL